MASNGESDNEDRNNEKYENKWSFKINFLYSTDSQLKFISDIFSESKKDLREGKYYKFIVGKVGVLLLFLSIALGIARAMYVQDNIHVKINGDSRELSLYMTTSSGVGLYDRENKTALFSAWDSIERMEFPKEKRRTFGNMFSRE